MAVRIIERKTGNFRLIDRARNVDLVVSGDRFWSGVHRATVALKGQGYKASLLNDGEWKWVRKTGAELLVLDHLARIGRPPGAGDTFTSVWTVNAD